ncbi:Antibiotic biosynthesis monooxygenase [uncultured Pleomorphomonas sp.]|uniref:Antibiotic biosynthesis monooxygenase n=1 Tax=uncultured Pleomorphomonas sp. TaxID=442121 RepID=A0A212L1D3_9HYPH|nr:putative quinol monooxygenase [uncultured Pleomorphomonas sp.]SCM71363.1 Antibiotic biosynthesis monooxygenase [uncultured Pleomorphomonas sp.]
MEVSLIAHLEAKDGLADALADRLTLHTVKVRQEPGNRQFQVFRHRDEPNRFEVVETYADQAAFESHIVAPHSVSFNAWLADMAVGGQSTLTFVRAI